MGANRIAWLTSPTYRLERRQWLLLPPEVVFAFFERPENLARITPPWLDFRILTPPPIAMAPAITIDYTIRVLGTRTHWRSLIAEYDPPRGFRDVQLIGPYRLWDHRHRFRAENGGTLVEDEVLYQLALGPVGRLAHALFVRRRLDAIFAYRRERIAALLSANLPPSPDSPRTLREMIKGQSCLLRDDAWRRISNARAVLGRRPRGLGK